MISQSATARAIINALGIGMPWCYRDFVGRAAAR
jgi:hypothetical protein